MTSRHLLSVADLGAGGIAEILDLTDRFVEVSARPIPRVPALRGKTVVSLFFEDSTRTRLSFETAAKRLSADTMTFTVSSSSVNKGESLRDTVETIEAMGVHAVIVRHAAAGVPWQVARWLQGPSGPLSGGQRPSVLNAGDGWHEHPTQALLDCYTIRRERELRGAPLPAGLHPMAGLHIGIVGDIRHSRVARSDVLAFSALGARVSLIGPPTLMPPSLAGWPVEVTHDLDTMLPKLDVVYLLRLQRERMTESLLPSLREYTANYGLTGARADHMADGALIMHPGPVNRGVEVAAEVADRPESVIVHQVANGVAVRMAVLFRLLGQGPSGPLSGNQGPSGPLSATSGVEHAA
ncbi:MAG TPA: aspartate carbamoyltransferase catalytic subunit [Acidimicrobiales bacterium]|nr:aspartate carbamoyltransferase catalytic subunit [Acidimicrobiales bacterium]